MTEINDTSAIRFDQPVTDGFIKIFEEEKQDNGTDSKKDTMEENPDSDKYLSIRSTAFLHKKNPNLIEWIVTGTEKFIINLMAATQLNLAKITCDTQWTYPITNASQIISIAYQKACVVSVSPELIIPRSDVQNASLIAPSGAYLTWIEMQGDELDDN